MYDSIEDPYCYPGTSILQNIPGLLNQDALTAFETVATAQRAEEPLPAGTMDVLHYTAIHQHLFQDIYPWAGEFRTVRIGKEGSGFCFPEHVPAQMEELFQGLKKVQFFDGIPAHDFARDAAQFLSSLNAIHPFREGNGRTQNVFLQLLAEQAGHPLHLDKLDEKEFLNAMVLSFQGDITSLEAHILKLIS